MYLFLRKFGLLKSLIAPSMIEGDQLEVFLEGKMIKPRFSHVERLFEEFAHGLQLPAANYVCDVGAGKEKVDSKIWGTTFPPSSPCLTDH